MDARRKQPRRAKSRSVVLETRIFQVATFPSFAPRVKSLANLVNVRLPTIEPLRFSRRLFSSFQAALSSECMFV